jgi:hypothetical protein
MIKTIKIGHVLYTVYPQKRVSDSTQHGSNESKTRAIAYDPKDPLEIQAEVLLHEVIHGLWEYFDMKDKEDEEGCCTKLSAGISSTFSNNFDFCIWYIESLHGDRVKEYYKNK